MLTFVEDCAHYITFSHIITVVVLYCIVNFCIVVQAFYNPHIISVIDQLISPTQQVHMPSGWELISKSLNRQPKIKTSSMYQIPLPKCMIGKTYGQLFHYLGENGILPISLYRGIDDNSINIMPYVFTNPPKAARLYACDKVFVLSQQELTSAGIITREDMEQVSIYTTAISHTI